MKKSWAKPNTVGYEIKVSRSDFVKDDKWPQYLPYCNEFYFVSPREVIADDEVPEGAGLIIVSKGGRRLYTKKKAPRKGIPEGGLELMYKGILMSRVEIRAGKPDGWSANRYALKYWEEFIREKEEKRKYGWGLRGKIKRLYKDRIEAVENENARLKQRIFAYEAIESMLKEMGVEAGSTWGTKKRVRAKLLSEEGLELKDSMRKLMNALGDI